MLTTGTGSVRAKSHFEASSLSWVGPPIHKLTAMADKFALQDSARPARNRSPSSIFGRTGDDLSSSASSTARIRAVSGVCSRPRSSGTNMAVQLSRNSSIFTWETPIVCWPPPMTTWRTSRLTWGKPGGPRPPAGAERRRPHHRRPHEDPGRLEVAEPRGRIGGNDQGSIVLKSTPPSLDCFRPPPREARSLRVRFTLRMCGVRTSRSGCCDPMVLMTSKSPGYRW